MGAEEKSGHMQKRKVGTCRRDWSKEAGNPSHEGKQNSSDREELWDVRSNPYQRTTPEITKESRPVIAHSGNLCSSPNYSRKFSLRLEQKSSQLPPD